jgi:CBS domain-containing protein
MTRSIASRTVRDLMQTDVVTVPHGTTVGQLMRTLSRHDIGGVPVVDDRGSVIGVVSASDVMGLAEWPEAAAMTTRRASSTVPEDEGEQDPAGTQKRLGGKPRPPGFFTTPDGPLWHFPLADLPLMSARLETIPVDEIMTPATFHVRPDATVPELSRMLLRAGIHRALVFDGSVLKGIVTSTDVLRAVAEEGMSERA